MSMPKTTSSERSKLGDLSEERITEFRRDGCTVIRGLCSKEEVASVRSRIAEAVADRSKGVTALSDRSSTYARAFLQVENIWETVDSVRDFTLSPVLPKWQPVWWASPASASTTTRRCSRSRAAGLRLGTRTRVTGRFGAGAP